MGRYLGLLILILCAHYPLRLLPVAWPTPNWIILYVIYYSQYHPSIRFFAWSIVMGFFDDSIGGTIIGISPMNYVIASIILHFFKKNVLSSSFFTLWLIIGLVIIITTMNTAFIYHVAWQHSMLYQPLWYEGLVTIIAYPIFHLLLRTIFEKQHAR